MQATRYSRHLFTATTFAPAKTISTRDAGRSGKCKYFYTAISFTLLAAPVFR